MKYNPSSATRWRTIRSQLGSPGRARELTQGWLELLATLEEKLCAVTGMAAATLQPAAGAAGVDWPVVDARLSQRERRSATSYLDSRLGHERTRVGDPRGYEVTTVPSMTVPRRPRELKASLARRRRHHVDQSEHARMFEEEITEIAAAVHEVGGLLYYDGANLNAILVPCDRATWVSTSCT